MKIELGWIHFLKPLVERDQQITNILLERGDLEDKYHPELERVQRENGLKLQKFIMNNGFPVLSNSGEEGVWLSWHVIQHAIPLPDFMQDSVIQMRLAAAQNDYPLDLLASTEDKISYLKGEKQRFGTYFEWVQGELKPSSIEDSTFLDHRRNSMGLPPMSDALFKIWHHRPPKNPQKRDDEFKAWLKKTGWRI
jgi:hypothetical protein